jgi:hypothetical protein
MLDGQEQATADLRAKLDEIDALLQNQALLPNLVDFALDRGRGQLYHQLKISLGKALLLGLEVSVNQLTQNVLTGL